MIEIPLMHGTIWINPFHVTSIEAASHPNEKDTRSFITMDNGNGWNTPLSPKELAERVDEAKYSHKG